MRTKQLLVSAAGLVLAGSSAWAQASRGTGTLQRDLQVDLSRGQLEKRGLSGGRNLNDELRFRNAMVTGNAPNGMSLRAEARAFGAPGEFMGDLGSDDLFDFRRDSLYSGLAGRGIRGTEALQYQFALTTGNSVPRDLTGPMTLDRGGGRTRDALQRNPGTEWDESRTGSLRSTSAFQSARTLQPLELGTRDGGDMVLVASGLRGLQWEPRFAQRDETPPSPNRIDTSVPVTPEGPGRVDNSVPTTIPPTPARPAGTGYDEVAARLAAIPDWQKRLDELRAKLQSEADEEDAAPAPAKPATELTEEELDLIRRAGALDAMYVPIPISSADLLSEHMLRGQELLREGRFFDAEERFSRALSLKPGEPTAKAGRVHAQLGAGMWVSAAINLRDLFIKHPEVLAVRYRPEGLPVSERAASVMRQLRERITAMNGGERFSIARDSALMLAYIGYQMRDDATTAEGLDALDAAGAAEASKTGRAAPDESLGRALRALWLGTAPAQTPAPAPQPGATKP